MSGFAFSNTLSSCHQPCFFAHLRNRRLLQSACSAFLAAMLLSLPVCIFGHVTSGTVTGDVTDSSGAVVPNAAIVITDVDRGSRYPATSNPEGLFLKTQIPNGRYRVRVEAQGFAAYEQEVVVNVNQETRIYASLKPAGAQQTVEVTFALPRTMQFSLRLSF